MLFSFGIAALFVVFLALVVVFIAWAMGTVPGGRRSPDGAGASRAARRTGDGLHPGACGRRLGSLQGGRLLVARVPC
jgi:hypothetical protein